MPRPSERVLSQACDELAKRDLILARAYSEIGLPSWRTSEPNYQTLARLVVYQLISTKAADAIWLRIAQRLGEVTPQAVLEDDQEALRGCGLSRPKLAHMNSIAQAVLDGTLDFERLRVSSSKAAEAELLAVKGIGPWTAQTFLMTAFGDMDAFPAGDVGLMESYKRLGYADIRHTSRSFAKLAEIWRPYRAVAAHLLYDWFNANRK